MMAYNNKIRLLFGAKSFQSGRILPTNSLFGQRFTHSDARRESQVGESGEAPLVDSYGRVHNYLRISLTERCNLRCQYCMPAEGVALSARAALLAREELLRLVRVLAARGVSKLRLTGGEPSVRADLVDVVQELRAVPGVRTLAMTSNGLALARRLPALQRAGLSALNLSLDSLRPERFEAMARRPGLPKVLASMDLALQLGFDSVKINTVLMKGFNDDEICDFIDLTRERKIDIRFIEFMPFSGNRWQDGRLVGEREALAAARRRHPRLRRAADEPCRTASMWQVPGYAGRVGFISSMTKPFCSSCNRLRLTADGNLKVCLFGEAETSLRDALRGGASDAELDALVRAALRRKLPQHAAAPAEPRRTRAFARNYCTSAPDRPASERPAPERSAPERPAPERSEPERPESERPDPDSPAPERPDREPPARRAPAHSFSHLDEHGRARMVDVGAKPVTARAAEAECYLVVGARLLRLLRSASLPKGDALTVAQVAGALAAKRTADLIPLCHPLPLELARVRVALPREAGGGGGRVRVWCEARATARTGVEMEALTGCAVAALALYDMCKSVDKGMSITELRVLRKSGGSSEWAADAGEAGGGAGAPRLRAHDTSPLRPDETYAPTNFMHF